MRLGTHLRRWSLVLACAAALGSTSGEPAVSGHRVVATRTAAAVAQARGGWRPHHLNACALALGLMWGGAVGIPINPMGGSTVFAVGAGIALFACS